MYGSGLATTAAGVWAGDVSTLSGEFTPPVLKATEAEPAYSAERADVPDLSSVIATANLDAWTTDSDGFAWSYLRTGLFALILVNAALLYWLFLGHRWMMRAAQSTHAKGDPHRPFQTSV